MKKVIVAGLVFAMVLGFLPTSSHLADFPAVSEVQAQTSSSTSSSTASDSGTTTKSGFGQRLGRRP